MELPGDWIGVVTAWEMPGALGGLTTSELSRVQKLINEGDWRESSKSPDWVGNAVARALNLNIGEKHVRARVSKMLATWTENHEFKSVHRKSKAGTDRHVFAFVEFDQWA